VSQDPVERAGSILGLDLHLHAALALGVVVAVVLVLFDDDPQAALGVTERIAERAARGSGF